MRLDEDDVATLHKQLVWLTKREGFTQSRLALAGIVDELLRRSLEDSFERLQHRFISAIYSLADDQSEVLLDSFALSPETRNVPELMQRRLIHGDKIQRKGDTVRTREAAALKQLHSRLVAGRYAQAPIVVDVPEMHGGIIYEEVSILIVVENRRWKETFEHHRFANMAGELDFVTIGRSYPGVVQPSKTGEFKVNTRRVEGAGWNDHFWHLNASRTELVPMQDRERYDVMFRLVPPGQGEEPDPITLGSRALHARSLLLTISVGFRGERPASIWKFVGASPYARPHAANEYNEVQLDEHGIARLTLRDVHGGLFNGFAWRWAL
ncbi:hypothetical protein QE410_003255 [Microbacterium sp. SORGH_AS 1204]|uniref:hypothetical protein n=1 Tax=Microbacterium sp. SORGH_AS_1204 TaxID=3041785 RepID=UPI0027908538|nr:hypothetical protein [Microbacterium sp. SORGH_AS_1204]MDQ1138456.1 hypothetical protein [Microbacterium sp. SORGH_AS_1204]